GANENSPNTFIQDERSYMEGRATKPISAPKAFIETISIRVCQLQLLYFNVRHTDSRVTRIHRMSPLNNKVNIGDKVLKINGAPFNINSILKAVTPHNSPSCSKESLEEGHTQVIMRITIERAAFSWCRLEMTTLEKLSIPRINQSKSDDAKMKESFTGRPLKRYTVVLRRPVLPGIDIAPLGLSLRYDSRERVTVADVAMGSVASAHLREWDIIKRVNGTAVHSKTMCAFMIAHSLRGTGEVTLSVEALDNVDTSSRDRMEMPDDVVSICAKQIAVLKSGTLKPLPSISARPPAAAAASSATTPKKKKTITEGSVREEKIAS
ncbi:hypothetical protein PMAYCL1PPCAC_06462, partial [Pristionchus mayeri]